MDNKTYLTQTLDEVYKRNLDSLMSIRKALIRSFGEENIQMTKMKIEDIPVHTGPLNNYKPVVETILNGRYYEIVIKFPEVLLTSQTGKTHTLYDLFVRIHLNQHLKYVGSFEGLRTSYTEAEWKSDYSHSHLSGLSIGWGNNFCTGSGPINVALSAMGRNFSIIDFELFCQHLKVYVGYESISGTPYRYISNIGGEDRVPPNPMSVIPRQIEFIFKTFMTELSVEQLKTILRPQLERGRILVEKTEDLERGLAALITRVRLTTLFRDVDTSWLFSIKKADGSYVKQGTSGVSGFRRRLVLRFKGQDVYTKIMDGSNNNQNLLAHPEITEYVCKKLSRQFTRTALTFNSASQTNQGQGVRAAAESNLLPV